MVLLIWLNLFKSLVTHIMDMYTPVCWIAEVCRRTKHTIYGVMVCLNLDDAILWALIYQAKKAATYSHPNITPSILEVINGLPAIIYLNLLVRANWVSPHCRWLISWLS